MAFCIWGQMVEYLGLGVYVTGCNCYHCDQVGAPQELTDQEGKIVWAADYTVWGEATLRKTGTDGVARYSRRRQAEPPPVLEQPFRFQGQQFDEETGLHYNYFRDYDPITGRYLQSDPVGLQGGLNTYAYVLNNPINGIDPLGLFELLGYQNRGGGQGWQSEFEFNFNPISEAPGDIAQIFVKTVNRINAAIDFVNTEPAGPLHPYKEYLQCGLLDKDLENDFAKNRFNKDRLNRNEALDYLNDMWKKYPQMRELYPSPLDMVSTAEQNSKNHWLYELNP